jgi:hypothetical protein
MSLKAIPADRLQIDDQIIYAQQVARVCSVGTLRGYARARRGGRKVKVIRYEQVVCVLRLPSGQHFEVLVKPHQKFAVPKGGAK